MTHSPMGRIIHLLGEYSVQVTFKAKRLQEAYETFDKARKLWGERIARRYVGRVKFLQDAASAQDIFNVKAFHTHPLKGQRAGQYAINLDAAWRLIVTFTDKEMKIVRVEEVSDHYDD